MTKPLRILILEDNPADAELVQFELEEAGLIFTPKVVVTEEDYVQSLQNFHPDLILSDYDLPKYNGSLALIEAKRTCPDTPFILVTGAVTEDRAIDILTQGAKDYVLKNRLQQRLVPAVRRGLAEAEEHKKRKLAEEELKATSLYSRSLIEASLDPLVTISHEGKVMDANKATEKITGVSREQIIGNDFSDYFTEPEKARAGYKRVFSEGSVKDYPLAIRHISGRVTEVLYNATVYKNEKGEVQGVFAAARDATELRKAEKERREAHGTLEEKVKIRTAELEAAMAERKKTEEALKDSEKRYRRLFEASKNGVLILDAYTGKVVDVNPFLMQLLGYSYDELYGQYIWELGVFKDIAASKQAFKTLQDNEYIRYDDLPLVTRNGQSIAVEFISNVYLVDHSRVIQCNIRDITEGKRAEEALRKSEERYRVLFEAMTEGFAIHEIITDEQNTPVDYRFLDINPAFERLTGLKREDVVGKTHSEVLPGDDPKWLRMYGAVALTGKPVQFENYSPALDRHYKVMAYSSAPRQFAVIFMDITERRHYDETIQIMLQRFHTLVSSIQSSILLVGEDGIELVNQAFCDYFGLSETPPDLIGLTAGQLIERIKSAYLHPEEEVTRIREIIDLGQPVIGEEIDMQGGKTCLRDFIPISINGKLYGRLWKHTDITKRRQAEEALRESEEKYRNLVKYAPSAIYEMDLLGTKFFNVNDAMCDFLRYSREELLSMKPADLLDHEGKSLFKERIKKKRVGETIDDAIEYRIRRKDGKWIHVAVNVGTYKDSNEKSDKVTVIAYDITERKEAELALKTERQQLEDANKELESFSYSVSHDLKAPLRAIDGYSRMFVKKYGNGLDEDGTRMVNVIRDNVERMGLLIDDLLTFSKVLKSSMAILEINMNKLVKEVCAEIQAENTERELELKITDMLPGKGDPTLIRQVLINLISNAFKFTKTRKPGIIEVSCCRDNGNVVYCIKDNGVGFDMAYYGKLFGVFQRLHSHEEYEGTGVGLAIVHRIIVRHGGRVWAEGEVNKGATFYFTFPQDA